jgi:hypothetical protein
MQKSMRDQSRIVVHAKFEYAPKVHFISHPHCWLWQYRLWSFQGRDTSVVK